MARYQLRRPTPIQVFPKRIRRQEPAAASTAAPAPEEKEEDEGPESPESAFSSPSTVGGDESPSPDEEKFPAAEGPKEAKEEESDDEKEEEKDKVESSSSVVPSQTSGGPVATSTRSPAPQITRGPSATNAPRPTITTTVAGNNPSFSSQRAQPAPSSSTTIAGSPAQSEVAGGGTNGGGPPPQKSAGQKNEPVMSTAAEAALITFTVLGGIALIIGAIIFMKRRRRRKDQDGMRHAEDAFDPGNTGSLRAPETIHVGMAPNTFGGGGSHMTQSTNTNSLFAAGEYERPETVSTDRNKSRFAGPQPTPNPFADPPLNKAYDVLRGRPRSTTLTDRGSWIKNPFKDPQSDRFDPFGELQEKARMERVRYMEQLQREREQQFLEKERMGLGVPDAARKGSGVTIEGLGVLDRSGSGNYR